MNYLERRCVSAAQFRISSTDIFMAVVCSARNFRVQSKLRVRLWPVTMIRIMKGVRDVSLPRTGDPIQIP